MTDTLAALVESSWDISCVIFQVGEVEEALSLENEEMFSPGRTTSSESWLISETVLTSVNCDLSRQWTDTDRSMFYLWIVVHVVTGTCMDPCVTVIYSCREQYAMHFLAVVWKAGKLVVAIPVSEWCIWVTAVVVIIPARAREYVFTGVGLSVCVCVRPSVTTMTKKIVDGFANFMGKGRQSSCFIAIGRGMWK